jgi:hypothetical protein
MSLARSRDQLPAEIGGVLAQALPRTQDRQVDLRRRLLTMMLLNQNSANARIDPAPLRRADQAHGMVTLG